MSVRRLDIKVSKQPNFFGCWTLEDQETCEGLVNFFEQNKSLHRDGIAGSGEINKNIKNSTDMRITPVDLETEEFQVVKVYTDHLARLYLDYLSQWKFLQSSIPRMHVGPFNIQKYDEGGHFNKLHAERTSLHTLHRVLAWMTYLNDVPEGGETEFPMFGLKIDPEQGKTLIWPAEWTHAHRGGVVKRGTKYIITGWMHFPDDL